MIQKQNFQNKQVEVPIEINKDLPRDAGSVRRGRAREREKERRLGFEVVR